MKNLLKRKLTMAILAGCSVIAIGGISLAATTNTEQMPPPPPCQQQMMGDFNGPERGDRNNQNHKEEFENYSKQLQNDYSMSEDTSKRAVRDFMSVDRAVEQNKITSAQSESLKKAIAGFYQDNKQYSDSLEKLSGDEAKTYIQKNEKHLFLEQNLDSLANETSISSETLKDVFRRPGPPRNDMQRPPHMKDMMQQLVNEQKVTNDEANAITEYMESVHKKDGKMQGDKPDGHKNKNRNEAKNFNEDERLAEMSEGTGISTERLKEIFSAVKSEMKAPPAPPEAPVDAPSAQK